MALSLNIAIASLAADSGLPICALRFFCRYVLRRRDVHEDLPYPKGRHRLPVVLSPDEVQRLIAGAKNLYHRTLLLTLDGAGWRRREACQLKVRDIDRQRMVLRVEQGKGGRDREIPLSPTLLALREYYRWMRSKTYLFQGTHNGWRADAPITTKVIWHVPHRRRATSWLKIKNREYTRMRDRHDLFAPRERGHRSGSGVPNRPDLVLWSHGTCCAAADEVSQNELRCSPSRYSPQVMPIVKVMGL